MPQKITQSDFDTIADVANHCDLEKLNIAIFEAERFDLAELFCDFWNDIDANWENETYADLINGSSYEGCKGTRKHAGVKDILTYYAYARYLVKNSFNDTPNGSVSKQNSFSIPKPLAEIKALANDYRDMGYKEFKRTLSYLCKNKESFENFDTSHCASCGCGGECGGKTSAKSYGFRSSIISKA